MCKLSGNAGTIETKKSDDNGKLSLLTTYYTDNATCVHYGKLRLGGTNNPAFYCPPIEHGIMVKIPGPHWIYKKITVGCKVVLYL
jgi:hypothetical protein